MIVGMKNNKKRGFTLIELLVVIAIIGILSSVVLASLNSARLKARDARRVADLKQIQIALELYYDANTKYPDDIYAAAAALEPTYISKVPKDPQTAAVYKYSHTPATGNATGYHLGAQMEQGFGATTLDDADRDLDSSGATWAGTKFNGGPSPEAADPWTYDVSNQ